MADISMCKNEVCELNDICYRFKAIPNEYGQAYADFHPTLSIKSGKMECEYFLTTKEGTGD